MTDTLPEPDAEGAELNRPSSNLRTEIQAWVLEEISKFHPEVTIRPRNSFNAAVKQPKAFANAFNKASNDRPSWRGTHIDPDVFAADVKGKTIGAVIRYLAKPPRRRAAELDQRIDLDLAGLDVRGDIRNWAHGEIASLNGGGDPNRIDDSQSFSRAVRSGRAFADAFNDASAQTPAWGGRYVDPTVFNASAGRGSIGQAIDLLYNSLPGGGGQ